MLVKVSLRKIYCVSIQNLGETLQVYDTLMHDSRSDPPLIGKNAPAALTSLKWGFTRVLRQPYIAVIFEPYGLNGDLGYSLEVFEANEHIKKTY